MPQFSSLAGGPRAKDESKDHEVYLHEVSLLFQGSLRIPILGNVGIPGAILRQ